MALPSDANAVPGDDHLSDAGLTTLVTTLDPSLEHLRKEYRCRAEEIFPDLGSVLADESAAPCKEVVSQARKFLESSRSV